MEICSAPFLLKLIALICCMFGAVLLYVQEERYPLRYYLLYYDDARGSNDFMVFSLTGYVVILPIMIAAMIETGLNDLMCLLFLGIGALFATLGGVLGMFHYVYVKSDIVTYSFNIDNNYYGFVLESGFLAVAAGICMGIDFVLQLCDRYG